ncbi:unnamed protein product [Protopolystoma xenopodis]|uniref:Uncharacterized protein n=1 Tax=Protopolystoma xenopodis TaxID=117903 RepID=A0A3S5A7I7_9PLAT|nr:unnamed protein product [Protopolystoma xenopodis]
MLAGWLVGWLAGLKVRGHPRCHRDAIFVAAQSTWSRGLAFYAKRAHWPDSPGSPGSQFRGSSQSMSARLSKKRLSCCLCQTGRHNLCGQANGAARPEENEEGEARRQAKRTTWSGARLWKPLA